MTKYQKAIKVRKICETQSTCEKCIYRNDCDKWFDMHFIQFDVLSEICDNLLTKKNGN